MKDKRKVLVVSSGYPSDENPYLCAFVHARVCEYAVAGFEVCVCVVDVRLRDESGFDYRFDAVPVHVRNMAGFRLLLEMKGPFDVIAAHFSSVEMFNVLERESVRTPIVVFFHGGDVLCEHFCGGPARPYFSERRNEAELSREFAEKKETLKRLASNGRFHWVFVGESLRQEAEAFLGFGFGENAQVIPNWIREDRFAFRAKDPELRKRIFFCRRFDDEQVYCVDTVMLAIRRLSERPCFKDLEFEIYGDGTRYETLVAPVLGFENVHLHRQFIRNAEMPEVFAVCGTALYPSRYDSQGVAISEAAASGLVVIGGDVEAVRRIYPQEEFGLIVNPDSPDEIAAAIERVHADAAGYPDLARRMSARARTLFSKEKTVDLECALLARLADSRAAPVVPAAEPALSVIVPAYNMARYLDVCLSSLVNHAGAAEMDVVVVNDGSTDDTLSIARRFEAAWPGVVRVVDKPNGGHGSCVNAALRQVRGRYVKVVDADDWLVGPCLERFVERLRGETADCVLTSACYDYVESGKIEPILSYGNLTDGIASRFDDMQFAGYGFKGYGPIIHTVTWRTEAVRASKTELMERVSYDDMQWNVLPLRRAETLAYYDLGVYRYTMGRQGQSVSHETIKRKWRDHDGVFTAVAEFMLHDPELTPARRSYVLKNVLAEFGCNDLYVLYWALGLDGVRGFLDRWGRHPELLGEIVRFALKQGGDAMAYLLNCEEGKAAVARFAVGERVPDAPIVPPPENATLMRRLKDVARVFGIGARARMFLKCCVPYGIVRAWQKRLYRF